MDDSNEAMWVAIHAKIAEFKIKWHARPQIIILNPIFKGTLENAIAERMKYFPKTNIVGKMIQGLELFYSVAVPGMEVF